MRINHWHEESEGDERVKFVGHRQTPGKLPRNARLPAHYYYSTTVDSLARHVSLGDPPSTEELIAGD